MARNPTTGIYTRIGNSFSDPVLGEVIDPSDAINFWDDLTAALNSLPAELVTGTFTSLDVSGNTRLGASATTLIPLDVGGRMHATRGTFSNGPVTASQPLTFDILPGIAAVLGADIEIGTVPSPYNPGADQSADVLHVYSYFASPYSTNPDVAVTSMFLQNSMLSGNNGTVNGASFNAITGGSWTNTHPSKGGAVAFTALARADNGSGDNFGGNITAQVPAGVTATRSIHALELDVNNGSSTGVKLGLVINLGTGATDAGAITGTYTLANSGGTIPASFGIFMQAGATSAGVSTGIGVIGQSGGAWPVTSSGTVFEAAGGTAAYGIRMTRGTAFSTAAIATPGFTVDGSGNITAGVFQGTPIIGTYGGTGVNNSTRTITVGGNLVTAGAASLPAIVQGDLWYGSATGVISALAKSASASQFLKNSGTSNNPAWAQPAFTDLSGSVAASQMPALTGDVTTVAGAVATTLATVNSNVGTFGSATQVSQVTVNAKGLITAVANVPIVVAPGELSLANTHILVGNASNVAADVALSGDATIANTGALTLASVVTAGGPTGSATVAPIITYDAKGRLTAVSSATITPAVGSITGLGTGVATALAINVGSAGAPVTFNGALGSPSSAGTLPAFTLGGTISGGGNQINNVVIGTTTPLAGTFTTLIATTINSLTVSTSVGTLTIPNNASAALITSGNFALTLTATATTNATFPAGSGTLAYLAGTNTWTGPQTFSSSGDTLVSIDTVGGANASRLKLRGTVAGFQSIRGEAGGSEEWRAGGNATTNSFSIWTGASTTLRATFDANGITSNGGNITFDTVAKTVVLKQGANGAVGTFTCNGSSTVTVSNTSIAITDGIGISLNTPGGTVGFLPSIKTITAGTGFTLQGTVGDTSVYNYWIIKNAA